MSSTTGIDYSEESVDNADECAWMNPILQYAETSTCFKRPRDVADGRGVDFSKPVSPLMQVGDAERDLLNQVRTRDTVLEIVKKCNFVYTPGILFNRKIIPE
ncbi:hypothetical protein TRFO_16731 [Tritrichomonas foetus]|uniref:Uncharacterized protein n=1 Tax=Tritrichomonas foetus TaxID=1144522 RepID=A0A1J4KTT8_9EUKA|nr:hypothetical protein TRFO_16731 [Tritrichomonas foetus]|eukprot:OHT13180.1 hypothetical protein TRFO_16731 [Tritrichomonas foetus]